MCGRVPTSLWRTRDLRSAARLWASAARDEHGSVLEQLGERIAVADHESVLQQRLELLWRAGSRSHAEANVALTGPLVCTRNVVFHPCHGRA